MWTEKIFSVLSLGHIIVAVSTLLAIAIVGIYEIIANFNQEQDDNLNFIMYEWSRKYYSITFAWGVIGGHLFLGSPNVNITNNRSMAIIAVLTLVPLLIDLSRKLRKTPISIPTNKRIASLALGLLVGHFIWTMNGIV